MRPVLAGKLTLGSELSTPRFGSAPPLSPPSSPARTAPSQRRTMSVYPASMRAVKSWS